MTKGTITPILDYYERHHFPHKQCLKTLFTTPKKTGVYEERRLTALRCVQIRVQIVCGESVFVCGQ